VANEWGVEPRPEESDVFGRSIPNWPAFADSPKALQYLKQHYRLVILSNVDRESGGRSIVHFILFLLCFYFGFVRKKV
jgi:2-haloacid dehalogenase